MLMTYNLSCLSPGPCKTHPEYNVVKPSLQHDHQVLTGHTLHPVRLLIIIAERLLQYTVNELCLLLLAKLQAILTYLFACPGILPPGLLVISQIRGFQA